MFKKLVILFIVLSVLAAFTAAGPVFISLQHFLSKEERVDGNILIIEGWLSFEDLMPVIEEFRKGNYNYIVTAGLKAMPDYYGMYENGYLIFYPPEKIRNEEIRSVEVKAYSTDPHGAHFNVWINDKIAGSFVASNRKNDFESAWNGTNADSVLIELNSPENDSPLFIKEIVLNKKLKIPYLGNSVYDISKPDKRIRIINDMVSGSELSARRLVALGIDSASVVSVYGDMARINQTLKTALATREWLNKSRVPVFGINIISSGTHSRRTWMTFKKVFGEQINTGIISLPDRKISKEGGIRYLKTARETLAYFYYCLILNFIDHS